MCAFPGTRALGLRLHQPLWLNERIMNNETLESAFIGEHESAFADEQESVTNGDASDLVLAEQKAAPAGNSGATSATSVDAVDFSDYVNMSAAERLSAFEHVLAPLMKQYQAGMKQMATRLEILNEDLEIRFKHNPINHIETRVKTPKSIYEKMQRRGYDMNLVSLRENVLDIAGIRVVASYIDDVYSLVKLLLAQDDLEVIKIKDYIAHPKENGYRSLHVALKVPVYFCDAKHMVPVEIQFRTVAMDFWASLEHTLRYKGAAEVTAIDMAGELKHCADMIEDVEQRMQILMHAVRTTAEVELSSQDAL